MPESPIIIALAAIIAGAVTSVSGFGLGSILTPLFMVWFPPSVAVAMVAIPHAVGNAVRWWSLRGEVDGPTFRQFGIASAIGGLTGAMLQPALGSSGLMLILAVLLIFTGGGEILRRRFLLPPTPPWRLAGGVVSGAFGGLVGNQGGIRVAVLLGFRLPPRTMVATATASALFVDAARLPVYLVHSGPALKAHAIPWLVATGGALVGTAIGVPVLGRIPSAVYHRVIGVLLVLLGLNLIAKAL